jgi:hypothetical protein
MGGLAPHKKSWTPHDRDERVWFRPTVRAGVFKMARRSRIALSRARRAYRARSLGESH